MTNDTNPALPIDELSPIHPIDRVSIGTIFGGAHAIFAERWGTLVGCGLVLGFYSVFAGFITSLLDGVIIGADAWFTPFSFLNSVAIETPLSVGPIYIAAATFRGEQADISRILIGFRRWPAIVLIALIIQLALLVAFIPLGVAVYFIAGTTGYSWLTLVALIALGVLLTVAAIYAGVRIYFATLLCADPLGPRLGAVAAIAESWRITRDHAWTLLGAAILIILIMGFTFLLLLIPGVLYGLPLTYAAGGCVYVYLTHRYGIIPIAGYDTCPHCGYDMTDLESDRCPECGSTVPRPSAQSPETHQPSQRRDQPEPPDIPLAGSG